MYNLSPPIILAVSGERGTTLLNFVDTIIKKAYLRPLNLSDVSFFPGKEYRPILLKESHRH